MENETNDIDIDPDFKDAIYLLNSEVYEILHSRQQHLIATGEADDEMHSVFGKTFQYAQRFNRYKNKVAADQVRKILSRHDLSTYEVSVIANLLPEEVGEAKTLLPSLKRLDDDQIQTFLNEIQNFRRIVADTDQPTLLKKAHDDEMDE